MEDKTYVNVVHICSRSAELHEGYVALGLTAWIEKDAEHCVLFACGAGHVSESPILHWNREVLGVLVPCASECFDCCPCALRKGQCTD
jgi:hypothetical protein